MTLRQRSAEHAGCDRALKRGGIGVVGHARRLGGRRQPMLGKRNQAEIEKEALRLSRRPAGREQEGIFGEGQSAHEVVDEVASAHRHPVARRRGDRGPGGSRLADQHRALPASQTPRFPPAANGCRTIVGQY